MSMHVSGGLFHAGALAIEAYQWRFLRGLIIMVGMESMEWNQPHGNHVFYVFETIPLTPFQPLL